MEFEGMVTKISCPGCGSKDVVKVMDDVVGWTGRYVCRICGVQATSTVLFDNPYWRKAHEFIKHLGAEGYDAEKVARVVVRMIGESEYLIRKEARLKEEDEYLAALDRQMDRYEAASQAAHDQNELTLQKAASNPILGGK